MKKRSENKISGAFLRSTFLSFELNLLLSRFVWINISGNEGIFRTRNYTVNTDNKVRKSFWNHSKTIKEEKGHELPSPSEKWKTFPTDYFSEARRHFTSNNFERKFHKLIIYEISSCWVLRLCWTNSFGNYLFIQLLLTPLQLVQIADTFWHRKTQKTH